MKGSWINTYPRPQMVRRDWMDLNSIWRFRTGESSDGWETIRVPFCPESRLSGIGRRLDKKGTMVYEREFAVPDEWEGSRVLLHFGAVDQIADVYINERYAGHHEGGYLPFTFDITEQLRPHGEPGEDQASEPASDDEAADTHLDLDWADTIRSEEISRNIHTIRVEVTDKLDHRYPWGKQKNKNGGMWYTPVSGIWQSVWLEPVPDTHIEYLKIDTGLDWAEIRAYGIEDGYLDIGGMKYRLLKGIQDGDDVGDRYAWIRLNIRDAHQWTPDDPHLYTFAIESEYDRVESYFALRTLTIEKRGDYQRLCLNGEPYFFNGLLDQGYWQDGIYTPESPDDFASDILAMKSLGFNTLRKHIKIEPEQFYYECDRLGMVVFQDMVNNSGYSFIRDTALPTIGIGGKSDVSRHRDHESRRIFLESMDETVRHLYNHPSICCWTIFNEGWGQFAADDAYDRLKALDNTRFIDSTSGWFHQNKSDVDSYHVYFKPVNLTAGDRPLVLSEFGGYACRIPGHVFNPSKTYGYRKCANEAALLEDVCSLYDDEIIPLVDKGLCAAIYTQVSDVEDETNGLLTYDREILKFKSYTGTGSLILIGRHSEEHGGRVLAMPSPQKIRAYVAENHDDYIRVVSDGYDTFKVSFGDRNKYEKGTSAAIVAGILEGFIDLFGTFETEGAGFDAHIRSEIPVSRGLGASAAFELLMCNIINERYFGGRADAVQMARIAAFAEREYYGKPCGMTDQLTAALGQMVMIDFSGQEPDIELIDPESSIAVSLLSDLMPEITEGAARDAEETTAHDDMSGAAEALGIARLGDINDEQFKRRIPELENKLETGELTELSIRRARQFYEDNERILGCVVAIETGNTERFISLITGKDSRD